MQIVIVFELKRKMISIFVVFAIGIKCSLDGFVKAVALARQWKMTVSKRWANASGEDKKYTNIFIFLSKLL